MVDHAIEVDVVFLLDDQDFGVQPMNDVDGLWRAEAFKTTVGAPCDQTDGSVAFEFVALGEDGSEDRLSQSWE
ncbi:MAG: hypothetical protein GY913_22315 [Proteobacteria bacterium]|nr:hypothetical protein [Pseudomonadota bacterium]MCP4919646.1 hypothetical protein [Pseudomonadota bacterium]